MTPPTWIEINSKAIEHNLGVFRALGTPVAPVLKSNAYGHGLPEVFGILQSMSGDSLPWLCTNDLDEALLLRRMGYAGRVLMCGPFTADMLEDASRAKIEVFIGHQMALAAVVAAHSKKKLSLKLHVEFDTGMSRQGFSPDDAQDVAQKLLPIKDLVVGICMHFANVEDVLEHNYADLQLKRFAAARQRFEQNGFEVMAHAASSASALIFGESRFDLMRVGISLYGLWPSQATKLSFGSLGGSMVDLKPALTWKARVTSEIPVQAGQFIGYGCTFRANHNMRVAVLPVGYFEGYPRSVSGSPAYVLIRGERCPVVGRICMNMMMVDVTHLCDLRVGEVATLIGTDGSETISAGDLASWAGTIHYEIVTRLNAKLPRVKI